MKDLKTLAEELISLTVEEVETINKELASKDSSVAISFVVGASLMPSVSGTNELVTVGGGKEKPGDDSIKVPPIGGGFPGDPIVIPGKGKGKK